MNRFDSDGVEIAFIDEGEGPPVVLIHGFGSNHKVNWVNTSWLRTLGGVGRRVIALDTRGHGASAKPYTPAAYSTDLMAADVMRLMDHLGLERAAVVGYSMGARIAAFAALAAPERLSALVLSGLASRLVEGIPGGEAVAAALEAGSRADITDPVALRYRVFAEQTKSDRRALAACIRASRQTLSAAEVGRIAVPTLVIAGADDDVSGSPHDLAALISGATAKTIPGRDHMSAVGDADHKAAVCAFLDEAGP